MFSGKLEKYFKIKKKDFEYDKKGTMYFKIEKMNEIVYPGPPINKPERLVAFKQAHKNVTIKNNQSFAKEKNTFNGKSFLEKFLKDNKKVMKDMGITGLKLKKSLI